MLAPAQWRGAARDLCGRAETLAPGPRRAPLLALADYYDGFAEDLEEGLADAFAPVLAHP